MEYPSPTPTIWRSLCGICLFALFALHAQGQGFQLKGKLLDATSKEPLPFASIVANHLMNGTTSDTTGNFKMTFLSDEISSQDTLIFSYLGYAEQRIALAEAKAKSPLEIQMHPIEYDLGEYIARPLTALERIQQAIAMAPKNYDDRPFYLLLYSTNSLYENKQAVVSIESVFKSFYHDKEIGHNQFKDQHQLLLFHPKPSVGSIQFMKKEVEKTAKKQRKKNVNMTNLNDTTLQLALVPLLLPIYASDIPFFDSNSFHQFSYTQVEHCPKRGLIVIDVRPTKKNISVSPMGAVRFSGNGKVYIDCKTNAIVKLTLDGKIKLSLLVRSIIWMSFHKLNIKELSIRGTIEFKQKDHYWYPYQTNFLGKLDVEKTNWFSKNEKAKFEFTSSYIVNKVLAEKDVPPITKEKKFSYSTLNVHNDMNVRWEDMIKSGTELY